MLKRLAVFFFVCFIFDTHYLKPEPVWGDDATSTRPALNIQQAVDNALLNNPMVTMAKANLTAADHRIRQARSGLLPQVDLNGSVKQTTNPMWAFGTRLNQGSIEQADFVPDRLNDPDAINNVVSDISLRWTLYNGGRIQIEREQAVLGRKMAELNLARIRQRVISQTATAYAALLLAKENDTVVNQTLNTARTNLKIAESTFKAGVSIKSDVLRAQVRIAKLTQLQAQSQSHLETAWVRLNTAMGTIANDRYRLVSSLKSEKKTSDALSVWIYSALHHRPDLMQAQLQQQIAEKSVKKARGAHLPTINLTGNYEINTENFDETADNYTVAAGVRINLFAGLRLTAKEQEAQSLLAVAKSQAYQSMLNIRLETESAYHQAQSARLSIDVSEAAVNQAEEALRIITNRYKNGLVTNLALLDAENALQQARMTHFNRLYDYKVATINLLLAAGTIDKQLSIIL